ncbi:MAG: ornithine cyclodeaminase family protein [Variibacter sp.]
MRVITGEEIEQALTYPALVEALREAFRADIAAPVRHHHTIPQLGADATLLLMPSWSGGAKPFIGCKIVTVFPDNTKVNRPSVYGQYLLLAGDTGEPLAILDGRTLTAWRTAAASALAATYLARKDASHLLMIGAGALAAQLIRAHAAMRPITRVSLWNRTRRRAIALAFGLSIKGVEVEIVDDLDTALAEADIVSCATLSATPLVRGKKLRKGAHVDLVGGFTPKMREADDDAIKRARLFVDTREGALKEAGDIVEPLKRKLITKDDVNADLFDLCRGAAKGRSAKSEITLFKSVGSAIEDLAAAMLVWSKIGK